MMKNQSLMKIGSVAAAALLVGAASAATPQSELHDTDHPVYRAQAERARRNTTVNRGRVGDALKAAGLAKGPLTWYAVPAMSDVRRLPDAYPEDGRVQGELAVVAAKGEFEPASFLIYAEGAQKGVELGVSDLKSEAGAVLPAAAVDLKVVKVWFQNGNAWISYFDDVGLALVPELLLHDEKLVKVDHGKVANYARLKDAKGERFVWISAPKELETAAFDPMNEPFADAPTLQPVDLDAGAFKQFFATVHVPAGQPEGVYRGTISVRRGGQALAAIPLVVRVLPFELPLARPYFDLDRDFIVSFMGGTSLSGLERTLGGDKKLAREMYRAYLVNQRDHGIVHPCVDQDAENFALLKELGLPTKPVMMGKNFMPWYALNYGGRMRFDQMMSAKKGAEQCADFYTNLVGHTDVLTSYGDEQGTAFVAAHRNAFAYFLDYGIKMGCAGHDALLYKGGYVYGVHPMGGEPDAQERIRPWNEIGDKYVGFYASQHTGSENPQFIRRQHGLLGYFNNLSMVFNYEFALGSWNDRANVLYKPMVVAYMNRGGLVDTLQWEGFREGIDDMRYATQLKLLARDAIASGNTRRLIAGKKALQYLALLKPDTMDLDGVRAEMTEHILNLLKTK